MGLESQKWGWQLDFIHKREFIVYSPLVKPTKVFGPCYMKVLAFRGVKFHVSFMTLAFKVVKIFLENLWLGRC